MLYCWDQSRDWSAEKLDFGLYAYNVDRCLLKQETIIVPESQIYHSDSYQTMQIMPNHSFKHFRFGDVALRLTIETGENQESLFAIYPSVFTFNLMMFIQIIA